MQITSKVLTSLNTSILEKKYLRMQQDDATCIKENICEKEIKKTLIFLTLMHRNR